MMHSIKHILFLIITLCSVCKVTYAQQDVMVSEYMFNGILLNPAYAGSHEATSVSLLHRRQWSNFNGAPISSILSADGALKKYNMGWGATLLDEKIGATHQTDLIGNYAYHLTLKEKYKLAFGLKGGISYLNTSYADLIVWDKDDNLFNSGNQQAFIPRLGAGIYFYTPKYFAGLSTPSFTSFSGAAYKTSQHFYLTGGYVIEANDKIKFKPSFLLKYQGSAPLQADLNLSVLFMDTYWAGISYRTGESIIFIFEYNVGKRFRIGYAYDQVISKTLNFAGPTHEFMLSFDFLKDNSTVVDPRYF